MRSTPYTPPGARIFGIGLSKTGTHTLTHALNTLGVPCVHYPDPALMLAGEYDRALGEHLAATDISVSAFYRELDAGYPGSLFILTTREPSSWLDSVEDHRRRRAHEDTTDCPKAAIRELVYGTRGFERAVFARAATEHERAVRAYFACRPHRLLVWDLCEQPAWEPLCDFLGAAVPSAEFPHRNARNQAA